MTSEYLLLDGVRYEQALIRLYGREDLLEIEPLYAGTPWQEVADLGPILVKPSPQSTILNEIKSEPQWQVAASLLSSPAPIVDVAGHLRQLNKITDANGNESLLRYTDPLVSWFWLKSYSPPGLRRVLGPVTQWRIAHPRASWLPDQSGQWHEISSSETSDGEAVAKLGQAQMAGLEKAYQWQLKERLYVWLQQNQPTDLSRIAVEHLDTWLTERLTSADAFGLTSERSIAIWCALSLSHGNEFTAANDGAYQQWIVRQKSKALLTADQELQQYYQESA